MPSPVTTLPDAYPLYWPDDWNRTASYKRQNSRYRDLSFARVRDELVDAIEKFGAEKFVITTCIALNRNGLPAVNQREPSDPGVAVWWIDRKTKQQRVLACDKWRTVRENLRALTKAVEAIRALERSGASQVFDRAQESFKAAALPVGLPWWCSTLGIDFPPESVGQVEIAYKTRAKIDHPDVGGSHEAFVKLGEAREEAIKWLLKQEFR